MGNIESYIKWRGDLTFAERPFCEVDNLLFAEIAYFDLKGIVPALGQEGSITLRDAASECVRQNRKATCMFGPTIRMMEGLAASKRFADVRLSCFQELLLPEKELEFAALCFELGDGTSYVAFRGTSDSLVGWREDFNMSFEQVPAQLEAEAYLQAVIPHMGSRVMVGGHSKGGNLAVYAAMHCPPEYWEKIADIYDNDGPGFCPELLDAEQYQKAEEKTVHIVPEFCVIGALFGQNKPQKIVASSASGLMQHGGMSWQVEGDHFVGRETLSEECRLINEIFDTWIESASMEQRKAFVKDFFDALEESGVRGLSDFTKLGIDEIEAVLLKLTAGSEKSSKVVAGKLVVSAVEVIRHFNFISFLKTRYALRGILGIAIGLFFMITPEISSKCMGIGLGAALLVFTGRQIVKGVYAEDVQPRLSRYKLIAQLAFMSLTAFFTAVLNLVFHFANLLVGVFFLVSAFRWLQKGFEETGNRKLRILYCASAVICFMMGIVPFASPGLLLYGYAFAAGAFILIYGVSHVVYALYLSSQEKKD